MTQQERIIKYMNDFGSITALGITQLSARICELQNNMSWHIHSSASVFDSDAYGVETDSPAHPSEIIENELKLKDEIAIEDSIKEFIKDTAAEYFNTSEWDDEWWDAWKNKFRELM